MEKAVFEDALKTPCRLKPVVVAPEAAGLVGPPGPYLQLGVEGDVMVLSQAEVKRLIRRMCGWLKTRSVRLSDDPPAEDEKARRKRR